MAPRKPTVTPRRPGERAPVPALTAEQLAFIERPTERVSGGHSPGTREAPAGHPTGTQQAPAGRSPGTRRAPGEAAVVQRRSGALRRLNTYLRPEVFEALAAYCAAEREDMARVVDRAVAELLRAKGRLP